MRQFLAHVPFLLFVVAASLCAVAALTGAPNVLMGGWIALVVASAAVIIHGVRTTPDPLADALE
jgi:hypothetical protein